jgi:hypothetical protein
MGAVGWIGSVANASPCPDDHFPAGIRFRT